MRSREAMDASPIDWHRSSLCQNSECVEIAIQNEMVMMRNSAEPDSACIHFTSEEFGTFLGAAKVGKFDLA